MTRFKWHTLDKRKRDPGFANERPEESGPFIDPASPFRSRRVRRLPGAMSRSAGGTSRGGWLVGGLEPSLGRFGKRTSSGKKKKKKKAPKKGRIHNKSGATTPFDTASLSGDDLPSRKSERADQRKKDRARNAAGGHVAGRQSPRTANRKYSSSSSPRAARRKNAPMIPGAPHGQTTKPVPVAIQVTETTIHQATVEWSPHPEVSSWKISCSDSDGKVVRRARVRGGETLAKLGGLRSVRRPLSMVVRGYSSDGRLLCEGSVGRKA